MKLLGRFCTRLVALALAASLLATSAWAQAPPAAAKTALDEGAIAGLAVTLGRVLGPAFGGNAIATVKPQLTFGHERPFEWAVEFTLKLIGF